MRETQKHLEAFDFFYSLDGRPTKENSIKVADRFHISERTFWNWYKKLAWKERVDARNRAVSKKMDEEAILTVADLKGRYQNYIRAMINKQVAVPLKKGEDPIPIETTADLDRLIKMDLFLSDQPTDIKKIEAESKVNIHDRIKKREEYYKRVHSESESPD